MSDERLVCDLDAFLANGQQPLVGKHVYYCLHADRIFPPWDQFGETRTPPLSTVSFPGSVSR